MIYGWALAITAAAWALRWFYDGPPWPEIQACHNQGGRLMRGHLPVVNFTPDSERYLAMGRGETACWPFHARFLVPWLCGDRTRWWHAVTAGSLILSGPALAGFARSSGLTDLQALACVVAFTGLWGAFGLLTLCPVLVDAPAMLFILLGGSLYLSETAAVWVLLPAGLLVGAIKETGPIWLALFAWHPAALVGLIVPALRYALPHPPADNEIISRPLRAGMMFRRGTLWDGRIMLAPWGIGGLALLNPSPQLWVALALAYVQPLMASDVTRLVQQIAPVVLVHAVVMLPEAWLPLALALHLFNPWQKTAMEEQPIRLQGIPER